MSFFEKLFEFLGNLFSALAKGPEEKETEVPTNSKALHDLVIKNSPGIGPKMTKLASNWFFDSRVTNHDYMVLIDFDYRETSPRMWLVDRRTGKSEVYKVAHASNSDPDKDGRPTEFSNVPNSKKSSLGPMVTAKQYGQSVGGWSKFEYAMKLDGLHPDLNGNVRQRAIVFHSSSYVNDIKGKLIGDSWGCPAVSTATAERIISMIDEGCLFFVYHKQLDSYFRDTKTFPLNSALSLIKEFEGLRLEAYRDPVGIPTIGFGTIRYPNGNRVKMGDRITQGEAEAYLLDHIEDSVVPVLDSKIKVPVTSPQYNALVSFVYNVGSGAFSSSTLLRKLNAGAEAFEVASELLRWNKADGKVLNGLVRRREAERKLFLS